MTKTDFMLWAEEKVAKEGHSVFPVDNLPDEVPSLIVGTNAFLLFEDGVGLYEASTFANGNRINLSRWAEDAIAWSQFLVLRDALKDFVEVFDELNLKRVRGW